MFGFGPILGPDDKPPYCEQYRAVVKDETEVFLSALQFGHPVYSVSIPMTDEEFYSIVYKLNQDVNDCRANSFKKVYQLPNPQPPYFKQGCFNCATYPVTLGMPVLFENGFLRQRRECAVEIWNSRNVPVLHRPMAKVTMENWSANNDKFGENKVPLAESLGVL